jgi:hypothetical protein
MNALSLRLRCVAGCICALAYLPGLAVAQPYQNNIEELDLKGPVKELKLSILKYKGNGSYSDTTELFFTFDKQGRLLRRTSKTGRTEFTYTDTTTTEIAFDKNGQIERAFRYHYNRKGELVATREMDNYTERSVPFFEALCIYNDHGLKRQVMWPRQGYTDDTTICIYGYNDQYQLVREEFYKLNAQAAYIPGTVIQDATDDIMFRPSQHYRTKLYSYNSKGDVVFDTLADTRKKKIYITSNRYAYNAARKLTKLENFSVENDDTVYYTKTVKYNTKGDRMEQETRQHFIRRFEITLGVAYTSIDLHGNWCRLEEQERGLKNITVLRKITYY